MSKLATYLHHQTTLTTRPSEAIAFAGHSWPYLSRVRHGLEHSLQSYAVLPLRRIAFGEYGRVHSQSYLDKLELMARDEPLEELPKLGIGCDGLEYCLPGYEYSLGGMYQAIDAARKGTFDRAYCFSLGGHHAFVDWGHGYCVVNPQAVAARYAQAVGFEKVLIVDWDLHHGDGTQSIFAHDQSVYCLSIHSVGDLYMAVSRGIRYATTAKAKEEGHCNIPILAESFNDDFFNQMKLEGKFYRASDSLQAFAEAIDNIPWQPDYVFLFSGYDAHINDQGKGVTDWTNDDYRLLTKTVKELAQKATCPILSVHGGGYNLEVAIEAARNHVVVLAE
jgi:acetoin utilization deacetylase AcuC-like enzyme